MRKLNTEFDNAIPYRELIPSPEEFTGTRFREVLQSHGLTVISKDDDSRLIKIAAHGEYPDIYINVPFAGHNFDKYVFSEASGNYATASIQNRPIERRLQYLNSILMNSEYVGEKITLDMLDSREPLNLAPGFAAIKELEQYKENAGTGIHSNEFFFNNPEGERERQEVYEQRSLKNMQIAEEAIRENKGIIINSNTPNTADGEYIREQQPHASIDHSVESTMRITAVVGGRSVNLSLNTQEQQRLMAVDDGHRVKLLDKMFPDAEIGKLGSESKTELLHVVNDRLFGKPAIFSSHIIDTNTHEQQPKQISAINPAVMSAANFEANMLLQKQEQSNNQSVGITF